ncbi:MAG: hypothetical protein ACRD8W_19605 [Nitrososphaeraceae archaeon]
MPKSVEFAFLTILFTVVSAFYLVDTKSSYSSVLSDNNDNTNTPTEPRSYALLTEWGTQGEENGQFGGINDVIVANDNIFVPDYENHRIQKFTSD